MICDHDKCTDSQYSLNNKKVKGRSDIVVNSSVMLPPAKESEGNASEPKGKEATNEKGDTCSMSSEFIVLEYIIQSYNVLVVNSDWLYLLDRSQEWM